MAYRRGNKVWVVVFLLIGLLAGSGVLGKASQLEEVNIPLLITGGIPKDWNLEAYSVRHLTIYFQRGDRIWLSANADGTGDIEFYPSLEIKIVHPNGTIAGRVISGGRHNPQDITALFAVGRNDVTVTLFPSFPDLTPKAVLEFVPLPPVEAGMKVTVSAEIMNIGMSSANCFFVTFSYRPLKGGTPTEFDRTIIRELASGDQLEVTGIFDTTNVEPGKYQICVDLDSDNFVEELNEDNNSYCTSLPFEITEPGEARSETSLNLKSPGFTRSLQYFKGVESRLSSQAISSRSEVSSSSLWLVKKTKTTSSRLLRRMAWKLALLQQNLAKSRGYWSASLISKKLKRALRYIYSSFYRPRLGEIARRLIDEAIELIRNIDFDGQIAQVKGSLPELRGELEALITLNDAATELASEALARVEELYTFLCELDPFEPDCAEIMLMPPVPKTWPLIQSELLQVIDLLLEARRRVPAPESKELIREAIYLLSPPLEEMDEEWNQVTAHLRQIEYQIRLILRVLRRGSRNPLGLWNQETFFSLNFSGNSLKVTVEEGSVQDIELQIFSLDGQLILNRKTEGACLQVRLLDAYGRILANGIYLYKITVKRHDGHVLKSKVDKFAVLR